MKANKQNLKSGEKKKSDRAARSSPEKKKNLLLRYPMWFLVAAVLVVYLPTLKLGYTELDDSIFIKEQRDYNRDLTNLITSFKRGVFNPTKDVYYRPLLLDSFVLNYQASGENIFGWHVVNVLLHLISVLLLFILLRKINVSEQSSFLLALLFAVHPVLSQAVAWIPGRNDTLLAVFVFGYLIAALNFSETNKTSVLLIQSILLLAALFTKETAVFSAPAAWFIIVLIKDKKVFERSNVKLYVSWLLMGLLWFFVRSQATLKNDQLQFSSMMETLPSRLIVLLQYLGKIFIPVNLSVFPILEDTPNIYGFIALLILAAIIFFSVNKKPKPIACGLVIYVLFFIPALLVPASLNDQDFEHRTYMPMLGMLIVLSETVLLKNSLKQTTQLFLGIGICVILSVINLNHQKNFNDPVSFWTAAVKTSPHSAYANMMLGARIDKTDKKESEALIRKAYALDSNEKYINYYMGVMKQEHDSVLASESFFQKELSISDYYMCYFHMARVAFEKNDKPSAIHYLEVFLDRDPSDEQGNNNLLLLYLDTQQKEKAKAQVEKMKQYGISVPSGVEEQLK
ncbi:MAG: tetratricopeptide repeat protein [Chitinophagales bacterium]